MGIKALRGMKDLLPPQSETFLHFIDTAAKIARNYAFRYIETPILEETALFRRSVGESSDIVGKEMYQFVDKGGNDVCMRPEGTAGVVRAFIEHKLDRQGGVHRFFYYGPMFRYERPQKGRLREFHQFGVESFGEASVYEDAAIILLAKEILDRFEIPYQLKINSLGCPECLPTFRQALIRFLDAQKEICEDCQRRKETNPIRVLDCKNERCQAIYEQAPTLKEHLCSSCATDFAKLQELLAEADVAFAVDTKLVRGLDYYTKTAFEFVSDALGAQNAVAGGGRYDNLVEHLGGKPTPAVGFAIGIERILEIIQAPQKQRSGYYIGVLEEAALPIAFAAATKLRKKTEVYFEPKPKSLKAHLKAADKQLARYAGIIGEDELAQRKIWIKDLEQKQESLLPIDELG